ncbi:MAG: D-alanine--D-alanine ligase [Candidatus Cloacimonadota bacterium]|nr:D-alanine--D-alanine ligase [Candidatus Cloacimonadota bacterium]
MNKRIVLLQGGISNEREVSLETSNAIKQALINLKKIVRIIDPQDFLHNGKMSYSSMLKEILTIKCDIVFNGLHGGDGENGTIQRLFEIHNINFTGSKSFGSFVSMNKKISKLLVQNLQLTVPKFISFYKNESISIEGILEKFSLPFVVKPNSSGSSVGITIVEKVGQLRESLNIAFQHDDEILIEEYIKGREITVAMLGNKPLPVVEIKPKKGWYDYQHKYTKGESIYEVPAKLSKEESDNVSNYALKIYNEFQCRDYARIDFRYDGEKFYFLEVNTLPGMTALSLVPMAAKAVGISFDELINRIIERNWN